MSNVSMADLSDVFLVGGAGHGADLVQNMYGMYVAKDQMYSGDATNIGVATDAHKFLYKPLRSTSLGHTPVKDNITKDEADSKPTSHLYAIKRDWKDSLVQTWKTQSPESTWEEFRDSVFGFQQITDFESVVSDTTFTKTLSYEKLVSQPHQELSEFIHEILPQEDNSQLSSFGTKRRKINLDMIDYVIQESKVRELRESSSSGFLESVGIHKEFLTEEQITEVDEFVASL
tara:strand:+ start:654 stop:1346 length:693 start_codon:yes stop_codon:yes gene_type:complete